jgi:hypothetical protein
MRSALFWDHDHLIKFPDTRIPSTKSSYMDTFIREAIELELSSNSMNREDGLTLNGTWKPLIHLLIENRLPPQ